MASAYGNEVTNRLSSMFSPENVVANQNRIRQVREQNSLASIMQKHQGVVNDASLSDLSQVSPEMMMKVHGLKQEQAKLLAEQNKPQVVSAGSSIFSGGKLVGTAPDKPTTIDYNKAFLPDGAPNKAYQAYLREQALFQSRLKPAATQTAQKPIYDTASNEWVYPPSEEFPQGRRTGDAGKMNAVTAAKDLMTEMVGSKEKPGIIYQVKTGGALGLAGQLSRVTDTQKVNEFNNIKESLSSQLRAVLRIPGEGALSDKEQAQYGLQLPDIKNDPAVNEGIIRRLAKTLETRGSSTIVQPAINTGSSETFQGHARPANFTDAQWNAYKAANGG